MHKCSICNKTNAISIINDICRECLSSDLLDLVTPSYFNTECPICLIDINDRVYCTKCFISFHNECIEKWISRNRVCPNCRNKISQY